MIPRPAVPAESPDRRPEPKGQAADLRLVIEEDQATGGFIYKTLDRRTGEVVKVLPREEVLKLKASEAYSPGTVVSTFD
jgi:flagellar protein FlaG